MNESLISTDLMVAFLFATVMCCMVWVGCWRLWWVWKVSTTHVDQSQEIQRLAWERMVQNQQQQLEEMRRAADDAAEQARTLAQAQHRLQMDALVAQLTADSRPVVPPSPMTRTGQGIRGEYYVPGRMNLPSNVKTAFNSRELYAWQRDMRTHDTGLQLVLEAVLQGCRRLAVGTDLQLVDLQHRHLRYTINFGAPSSAARQRYSVRLMEPFSLAGVYDLMQTVDPETLSPRWHFGDYALEIEGEIATLEVRQPRSLESPDPELITPEPLELPNAREQRSIQLD